MMKVGNPATAGVIPCEEGFRMHYMQSRWIHSTVAFGLFQQIPASTNHSLAGPVAVRHGLMMNSKRQNRGDSSAPCFPSKSILHVPYRLSWHAVVVFCYLLVLFSYFGPRGACRSEAMLGNFGEFLTMFPLRDTILHSFA